MFRNGATYLDIFTNTYTNHLHEHLHEHLYEHLYEHTMRNAPAAAGRRHDISACRARGEGIHRGGREGVREGVRKRCS